MNARAGAASFDAIASEARARYRAFIEGRVNPGAVERDEKDLPIPRQLIREAAEVGLLSLPFPPQVGGMGLDPTTYGVVLEQIGYLCQDLALPSILAMCADVAKAIYDTGRPDFVERYVRPMCRGERIGCLAYTDETDAFGFRSTAVRARGGYTLQADKSMQTGGLISDSFLTYVAGEGNDLLLFLVERDDPGVEITPVPLAGFRSGGVSRLRLHDVWLPPERLLVAVDGLSHAQRFLNFRRIFLACGWSGRLQALLEACIRHLRETIRSGRPLTEMQNVQAAVGRIYIAAESARASLYRGLERLGSPDLEPYFDPVVSAAKHHVIEQALAASQLALRLVGGKGYSRELPFERYLRDFCAGLTGAGTQDILEINLGIVAISEAERKSFSQSVDGRKP